MTTKRSDKLPSPEDKEVTEMPDIACDWCDHSRVVDLEWGMYKVRPGDIIRGLLVCSNCGGRSPFEIRERTITFKPGRQLLTRLNDTVPADVGERYDEAALCLYAAAYRAAAVMSRAAVEQALVNNGITSGTLENKIDEALRQGIIGKEQHSIAHGSRLIGNDAVHKGASVSPGEVPAVLSAAANLINHVF
jgi:hypothetical protein